MRRKLLWLGLFFALAGCSSGPGPARLPLSPAPAVEVIVSAAASLSDALQEAGAQFEIATAGVKLRFNFGSSGALGQQIEQGAPVDLFISAAPGPMESLVRRNLVDGRAVRTVATNRLVLIRSKAGPAVVQTWADLKGDAVRQIAVGNPQHVPAGQYARTVLEHLSLWGAVQTRLVLGEDVRQVLQYTESGAVQAGIVYSTDAATSAKVVVVAEAPAGSHPPVTYPLAVLQGSRHPAEAGAFADYLKGPAGTAVLRKYGFGPGN